MCTMIAPLPLFDIFTGKQAGNIFCLNDQTNINPACFPLKISNNGRAAIIVCGIITQTYRSEEQQQAVTFPKADSSLLHSSFWDAQKAAEGAMVNGHLNEDHPFLRHTLCYLPHAYTDVHDSFPSTENSVWPLIQSVEQAVSVIDDSPLEFSVPT